jgi:hypothetical protein
MKIFEKKIKANIKEIAEKEKEKRGKEEREEKERLYYGESGLSSLLQPD